MITAKERGFTVIELMLFLGVSGALLAALMFGVNASVNQQRYKESVVSLSALLQKQYTEVSNTRNSGTDDWACTANGELQQDSSAAIFRGTSPCVLLGKAVQIEKGERVIVRRVVGCEPSRVRAAGDAEGAVNVCGNAEIQNGESANDLDALKSYKPKLTDFDLLEETVEWDSRLTDATEKHEPLTAHFLILRSPASGLIRVFTTSGELPTDLRTVMNADSAKSKLRMCVYGDASVAVKQSLTIDPSISGPDGVIVNQADRELCG